MKIKKYLQLLLVFLLCISTVSCSNKIQETSNAYYTEIYFSPDGNAANRIIKAIDDSSSTIDLAIFDLTSQDIKQAFERAKNRSVKIRIIADSRQAKGVHSIIQSLVYEGFDIRIRHGKGRGIMHNKFAIFDSELMVTGSYNWTNNAERNNYENTIFISDLETIKKYQKEFDKIWNLN
jgi:mitochondrial cardiolipin hydrolase